MLELSVQRDQICALIANRQSTMKILLKTKDEPIFLGKWIAHHQEICGLQNLIIFDNMSTDPQVLELYETIGSDIIVIRFSGHHNQVHHIDFMVDIYESIRKSTDYFCFLDTDEYLIGMDGLRVMQLNEINTFFQRL